MTEAEILRKRFILPWRNASCLSWNYVSSLSVSSCRPLKENYSLLFVKCIKTKFWRRSCNHTTFPLIESRLRRHCLKLNVSRVAFNNLFLFVSSPHYLGEFLRGLFAFAVLLSDILLQHPFDIGFLFFDFSHLRPLYLPLLLSFDGFPLFSWDLARYIPVVTFHISSVLLNLLFFDQA